MRVWFIREIKCLFGFHRWSGHVSRRVSGYRGEVLAVQFSVAFERCIACGRERICDWDLGEPG